ncbi:immunoglobulin superfamily member 5 [Phyllostomus discolor]|uniref:immunoglobulin superfamily member 5 n=1 Tax=Phyllostomus discolor TaxID=89673 RepID=UPI00105AD515|nr:immunoglobulin superfamily member 5 [Phyllostomus discolor]KAF6119117.1 immunoglobulin superfamily member 5 [Phyllostomus discolor]
MEGSWRGILAALVVVAGLPASGSSNQIIEGPRNTTALVGGEAHFNCTVSQGWRLIMWALNGTVVLSVTPKEPIITSDRFTSASYEEGGDFISEMIIHDVKFSDAGRVKCSLQNSDSEGSAFLSVQVVGKLLTPSDSLVVIEDEPCNVTCRAVGWMPLPDLSWEIGAPVSHSSYHSVPEPDDPQSALSLLALTPQGNGTVTCVANMKGLQARDSLTINLTVVPPPLGSVDTAGAAALPTWAIVLLAVSLSLLFILIIVLIIIFCCCCVSRKQEKESSYQSEVRNSPNVKANKETLEPKFTSGNENYGYTLDEQKTKQPVSLPPELHDASVLQWQRSGQAQQGPDHQQPGPTSRPQVTLFMAGPKQVRNVTLV